MDIHVEHVRKSSGPSLIKLCGHIEFFAENMRLHTGHPRNRLSLVRNRGSEERIPSILVRVSGREGDCTAALP